MLAFGADAVSAAFYDFLITIILEAVSIILFYVLIKTEYFMHYAGETSNEKVSLETLDRRDEDAENSSTTIQIYKKIWVWIFGKLKIHSYLEHLSTILAPFFFSCFRHLCHFDVSVSSHHFSSG